MPTGTVKWIDPQTGEAQIVGRAGREYAVRASEMDPHARAARARVTFDVAREGGVARARNVRLHEGTRTSPRQRRFGDLAGASRPYEAGSRPSSRRHADRGGAPAPRQPVAVALAWAEAVEEGNVSAALRLYAPDVVVHLDGSVEAGRRAAQRLLEGSVLLGVRHQDVRVIGEGPLVRVRWRTSPEDLARSPADERRTSASFRVERGQIVEQWA